MPALIELIMIIVAGISGGVCVILGTTLHTNKKRNPDEKLHIDMKATKSLFIKFLIVFIVALTIGLAVAIIPAL